MLCMQELFLEPGDSFEGQHVISQCDPKSGEPSFNLAKSVPWQLVQVLLSTRVSPLSVKEHLREGWSGPLTL